jgi:diguanylate cyclase (GGDEF)-like protein
LLDIDYFKQVNDSLGHPYGDLCLCEVAGVLSRVVRGAAEHVCRFGGDEFGLILPGSGLDRAAEIVEQIRDQVKGLKLRAVGGQRITLSIGVAVVEVSGAYSVGSVLEEADQRLYEAKRRGRDRVEFRSLPEPSWQIDPAAEQDTMVG